MLLPPTTLTLYPYTTLFRSNHPLKTKGGMQNFLVVSEFGLYEVIFSSRKKEAKDFKRWVFEVIKDLRKQSGLEGFQIFRMRSEEHTSELQSRGHLVCRLLLE